MQNTEKLNNELTTESLEIKSFAPCSLSEPVADLADIPVDKKLQHTYLFRKEGTSTQTHISSITERKISIKDPRAAA